MGSLVNYTHAQWMEFFHMSPSTAQRLVKNVGPLFHDAVGVYGKVDLCCLGHLN